MYSIMVPDVVFSVRAGHARGTPCAPVDPYQGGMGGTRHLCNDYYAPEQPVKYFIIQS